MARRGTASSTDPFSFAFLGFADGWYVLRVDMASPQASIAALAFEGRVSEWLISQRVSPGVWSHFGRGNTGDYPAVPEDAPDALYLLLKRPADVVRLSATFRCTGLTSEALLAALQAEASVHHFIIEDAARVAHDAIRALMQTTGGSYPTWEEMGGETRVAFILQVRRRLDHPDESVERVHQDWVDQRHKDGWKYGARFSERNQRDPLLVPWRRLNAVSKTRYRLMASVVTSVTPLMA